MEAEEQRRGAMLRAWRARREIERRTTYLQADDLVDLAAWFRAHPERGLVTEGDRGELRRILVAAVGRDRLEELTELVEVYLAGV